jgi:DNA-binding NarL/FixJ family response regulator
MSVYVTAREEEILALIKCGADTLEIAATIGVSKWTIRDQIRRLGVKLQAPNMAELPDAAAEHGIHVPDCAVEDDDDGTIRVDGRHADL